MESLITSQILKGHEVTKPTITDDGFIEKCNKELKKHPEYEEGMRFIKVPQWLHR